MHGRALLCHGSAHGGKLLLRLLPGIFHIQHPCRLFRKRWAVRPDLADEVAVHGKGNALFGKRLLKLPPRCGRHCAAIHAEHAALRHLLLQICKQRWHALLARALQHNGRAGKLLLALEEIPPIHPQRGFMLKHNQRAC